MLLSQSRLITPHFTAIHQGKKKKKKNKKAHYECPALDDFRNVARNLTKNDEEFYSSIYWHVQNLQ